MLIGDNPVNSTVNADPTSLTNFANSVNSITSLGTKVIAISVFN